MASARPVGLRLIILYKGIKSVLQLVAAAVLFYGLRHGLAGSLTTFAAQLREHAVHAWSESAATAVATFLDHPHGLMITGAALAGDGVLSGLEGWVLARGYGWGPWLVVGATGGLLPFELVSFLRQPHAGRLVLFVLNAAIVLYLATRARREHADRADAEPVGAAVTRPGRP